MGKKKYLGSVLFFKHIVVTFFALMILIASGMAVYYKIENNDVDRQIADLQAKLLSASRLVAAMDETVKLAADNKPQELVATITELRSDNELQYQSLFPELYIETTECAVSENKTAYLTFDDGPSKRTEEILDILKEKGVNATFFVIGENLRTEWQQDLLRRMIDEGHTIGIHTYSHNYEKIYESVASYLEDFNQVFEMVYEITGEKSEVFRFPGGSINGYTKSFYQELIAEMLRRGFVYYDWNVSSEDAAGSTSAQKITESVITTMQGKSRIVILMHDSSGKKTTVAALPNIIDKITDEGYQFHELTREVKPIIFGYK